jgi:hypothetical protein
MLIHPPLYVQLGHGSPADDKVLPSLVEGLRGVELSRIASLSTHSVAVTKSGGRLLTCKHKPRPMLPSDRPALRMPRVEQKGRAFVSQGATAKAPAFERRSRYGTQKQKLLLLYRG